MLQILSNAVQSTVAPLVDAASEATGAALAVKAMLNHESRLELSVLILQSYNLSQSQLCAIAYSLAGGIMPPQRIMLDVFYTGSQFV